MKKNLKWMVSAVLCSLLILPIETVPVFAVSKVALNNKLQQIRQTQSENQQQQTSSTAALKENRQKKVGLLKSLEKSQKKIGTTNLQITNTSDALTQNRSDLQDSKIELRQVTERLNYRKQLLKQRIRAVYINGGSSTYLDVLMGSRSFENFISRLLALRTIANQDVQMINAEKRDQALVNQKKQEIRQTVTATEQNLANLQSLKNTLEAEKKQQQLVIGQLKKHENELEDVLMSKQEQAGILKAQEAVVKEQLAMAERKVSKPSSSIDKNAATSSATVSADKQTNQSGGSQATEKIQNLSSGSTATASSRAEASSPAPANKETAQIDFIKPAAGSISSGFGYRTFDHEFHPGIDIANSAGTPIVAAASGVVFRAYQSTSYGNCVMISHVIGGQIYTTVYAHMSSYSVQTGQSVSQGQQIGTMGATGEAFGTHLHFEIYRGYWTAPPHNGAVNPMDYIR